MELIIIAHKFKQTAI